MEWKIGEIKQVNGEWYQCVVAIQGCRECSFRTQDYCTRHSECLSVVRSDGRSVIFKKLEKVGEPYIISNKLIQRYKIYPTTYQINVYGWYYHNLDVKSWTIDIEIKQNKEDMEEKKLNLKPFDIQKAREGKPVCTRGGRKARIIYFNAKGDYPIVALIETENGERVGQYMIDGHCTDIISQCCDDLMMLPEKKEGWVNVYKDGLLGARVYKTRKEAYDIANPCDYVDTVKISWEE